MDWNSIVLVGIAGGAILLYAWIESGFWPIVPYGRSNAYDPHYDLPLARPGIEIVLDSGA